MEKNGWSQYDLQDKSGVPQSTIHRILKGEHKDPRSATLKKIAAALGTTEMELRTDNSQYQQISNIVNENSTPYNVIPIIKAKNVPVVGKAQLGDNGHWCEIDYPTGHGDGYIAHATKDENAYALRCVGDSMKPRINNGEFVIVEPNTEAQPGDEVLVKSTDGRVLIKIYLYKRDGSLYLQSVNEAHPIIAIPLENVEKLHFISAIIKSVNWHK